MSLIPTSSELRVKLHRIDYGSDGLRRVAFKAIVDKYIGALLVLHASLGDRSQCVAREVVWFLQPLVRFKQLPGLFVGASAFEQRSSDVKSAVKSKSFQADQDTSTM